MTPWISVLLLIGFGLILTVYGYALWRIALVVGGFALGFIVGAQFAAPDQQVLSIVVGVVTAVVFGLLSYFAYAVVSVLIGVVMGALAGLWVAYLLGLTTSTANVDVGAVLLVALGAVVGVVLGIALRDLIIVLLTAVAGGGAVVTGVQQALPLLGVEARSMPSALTVFLIWAVVAVFGIVIQYILFRRRLTGNLIPG
jgi:hypothetical protein